MKIYMIYSKEMKEYVTQARNCHDRAACFSSPEKAVEFLKRVTEKGISEFCRQSGNWVVFSNILDKSIKYIYEIEEVELDDFYQGPHFPWEN